MMERRMAAKMTEPSQFSGFLNVDKPPGLTSHDVVARLRRHGGIRRVGHAGTLDPLATGVLVVCLGQGTRLAEFLARSEKQYRTVLELGRSTDTYDRTGRVVAERDATGVTAEQVTQALAGFQGRVWQVPPAYSALKQDGVPFYRLARAGKDVRPEARLVEISSLNLVEWALPRLTLELTCSAGTYVRSLAQDLGQALGCGAHVLELVRLRSGRFRLEDAVALEDLLLSSPGDGWPHFLYPLEVAVEQLPRLGVDDAGMRRLSHGQALAHEEGDAGEVAPGDWAQVQDPQGALMALVRLDSCGTMWLPQKVLVSG
jgi:tRNA pseudouridine55 synthase